MSHSISILTVGSELLDGRLQDTNSFFLISELTARGYKISQIVTCNDRIQNITDAIGYLRKSAAIVIVTGGLGPTSDDLTRDAISKFSRNKLLLNHSVLSKLKERYEKRKRPFNPANEKQAYFPEGAMIIENPAGTAAGFSVYLNQDEQKQVIISLPGVPHELKVMLGASVLPFLAKNFSPPSAPSQTVLRIFGLTEAAVGHTIDGLSLPSHIDVSYRASFPEIQVVLTSGGQTLELEKLVAQITAALGEEFIFSKNLHLNFEQVLHQLLHKHKLTISSAESCTGGLLGHMLTNTPGSSAYYSGGIIAYSNTAKIDLLGVEQKILETHGAVSHETAKMMASGVRNSFQTDFALSITGIAGPNGGTDEKPVGTFYVGLQTPENVCSFKFFYPSARAYVQTFAAYTALDLIRRHLLGLSMPSVQR